MRTYHMLVVQILNDPVHLVSSFFGEKHVHDLPHFASSIAIQDVRGHS
jgi:hypothetical protein